jgi:pyruvate kinase
MPLIRTKIIATLGPASDGVETLVQLFDAGVDVCRLNFSHGTLEQHAATLANVRAAAAKHGQPIAVLGDLGGPKIRLGEVRDVDGAGGMPIAVGEELVVQRRPTVGEQRRVSSTYAELVDDVNVGDRVLIEDGLLRFICTDKSDDQLRLQCTAGGVLKTAKGINLPNSHVNIPSVTDRDWRCIDWAVDNDLDYLALSFVRQADEVNLVRECLRNKVSDIHIIAKIEKAEAIRNIDAIVDAADGLMIARGDLGVEMDVAAVPIMQKDLIRRCQTAAKPVIVATQMLQSMIEHSSPTRAEVSDVANAIFDGTDAVMLSGETSVGQFPVPTVHTMAHIAEVTECYLDSVPPAREPAVKLRTMQLSAAVARGVRQMVGELNARLVVIYSQTGATARIFSKFRFSVPLIALSTDPRALRRMALHYGVIPQQMAPADELGELVARVDRLVQECNLADAGDRIVVVAGSSLGTPGTMNGIVLHTVGERWTPAPAIAADATEVSG